jgi:prevent-host-death family protein
MHVSDIIRQPDDLVDAVVREETCVIIEREGVPMAVIVSAGDLRRWLRFERHRKRQFKVIDGLPDAFNHVPPEEFEQGTDRIITGIRAEDRERAGAGAASH